MGDNVTLTLHLGVEDIPYNEPPTPRRIAKVRRGKQRVRAKVKAVHGEQTTGDVATILEAHYHLFTIYFELHEEEIAGWVAESIAGATEDLMAGGAPSNNPFGAAMDRIKVGFTTFIDTQEMDGTGTPGVPTGAARRGVNHRLGIKKGLPRPSFRDTGLMESSFVAWMTGEMT